MKEAISEKLAQNRRDMTGESSLPEIHQIHLWTKMEITGEPGPINLIKNSSKLWILSAQFLGPKSQRGGMRATQMALPNGQILTTPASL